MTAMFLYASRSFSAGSRTALSCARATDMKRNVIGSITQSTGNLNGSVIRSMPLNTARPLNSRPSTREVIRAFSSSSEKKNSGSDNSQQDDATSNEIVLTPGEKVQVGGRLLVWSVVGVFAAGCAYFIGKELIPTKMSPNTVFDNAIASVRQDPAMKRIYGDSLKFYGRDHGGHREGRRNFIEHTEYKDNDDGSNRIRVRFNLEGAGNSNAFVFAEVSSDMPSGEFVYLMVQNKAGGRVHTIIDNRTALKAKSLGGSNDAFGQLLGGGSSTK